MIESFEVKPNQLEKERPYVENGIALTRRAFGLDAIQESFFPAEDAVTAEEVRANPETIRNIRLWDHRPLRDTLNQIQSIRSYYTFVDVDVDRYQLDDGYRQVMVAVRELNRDGLPDPGADLGQPAPEVHPRLRRRRWRWWRPWPKRAGRA